MEQELQGENGSPILMHHLDDFNLLLYAGVLTCLSIPR